MKRYFVDHRALIETRARNLARSGKHWSSASIKAALKSQGFEGVNKLFDNRWTRSELDRICEQARASGFSDRPQIFTLGQDSSNGASR